MLPPSISTDRYTYDVRCTDDLASPQIVSVDCGGLAARSTPSLAVGDLILGANGERLRAARLSRLIRDANGPIELLIARALSAAATRDGGGGRELLRPPVATAATKGRRGVAEAAGEAKGGRSVIWWSCVGPEAGQGTLGRPPDDDEVRAAVPVASVGAWQLRKSRT